MSKLFFIVTSFLLTFQFRISTLELKDSYIEIQFVLLRLDFTMRIGGTLTLKTGVLKNTPSCVN